MKRVGETQLIPLSEHAVPWRLRTRLSADKKIGLAPVTLDHRSESAGTKSFESLPLNLGITSPANFVRSELTTLVERNRGWTYRRVEKIIGTKYFRFAHFPVTVMASDCPLKILPNPPFLEFPERREIRPVYLYRSPNRLPPCHDLATCQHC
jgi:hypothetical protein